MHKTGMLLQEAGHRVDTFGTAAGTYSAPSLHISRKEAARCALCIPSALPSCLAIQWGLDLRTARVKNILT